MTEPDTHALAQEAVDNAHDPRTRRRLRLGVILFLLSLVVMAVGIGWAALDSRAQDRQIADVAALAGEYQRATERLAGQVEDLGGTPVVDPDELPNVVPPQNPTRTIVVRGPAGPPPSTAEVTRVVRTQLGGIVRTICGGTCAAEDGTDGIDGRDAPTLEQILTATSPSISLQLTDLFEACVSSGRCVGPAPQPAKDGKDGRDGTAGRDAYPFTFRFTQFGTTYSCTVTDPAVTADCAADEPPVEPDPDPTEPTPDPTDTAPVLTP